MKKASWAGIALCIVSPVLWGTNFPAANRVLGDIDAFWLTLFRFVIGGAIFVLILFFTEGRGAFRLDGQGWRLSLLGTLGFSLFGILTLLAVQFSNPVKVALIMAMQPTLAAILNSALTKRLPPVYTIVTIITAFIGVSLVVTEGDYVGLVTGKIGLGEALALLGALFWVMYSRAGTTFAGFSSMRYSTLTMILSLPVSLAITLIATAAGAAHVPTWDGIGRNWLLLVHIGAVISVIGVVAWNAGTKAIGPVNSMLFMNLVPVVAIVVELFLGYQPSAVALAGAAVVILSLVTNGVLVRRAARSAEANRLKELPARGN